MSTRVRPPAVSFLLFVLLCAGAWFAYSHRDWLKGSQTQLLPDEQRQALLERIREEVDADPAYVALRGSLNWRPNEQRYRLDVTVAENREAEARRLCQRIAEIIREQARVAATVIAYDDSGREVAREVL